MAASPRNAGNAARLRGLWRHRFTHSDGFDPGKSPEAIRGLVATPLVVGDTVYIQDSTSSVYALDLATGVLRWEHRFRAQNFGRNGLLVSSAGRLPYGNTDTTAFALSAATGRLLWYRGLLSVRQQFVDIAPLYSNGIVYTSTVGVPVEWRSASSTHSLPVAARSSWKFSTIRGPWSHPAVDGGGGAWYTPSIDDAGNLYSGVANPYPLG